MIYDGRRPHIHIICNSQSAKTNEEKKERSKKKSNVPMGRSIDQSTTQPDGRVYLLVLLLTTTKIDFLVQFL